MAELHYRGDTKQDLLYGIFQLLKYARSSKDTFTFGPLDSASLVRDGINVVGPDLSGPKYVLDLIGGLAEVDR